MIFCNVFTLLFHFHSSLLSSTQSVKSKKKKKKKKNKIQFYSSKLTFFYHFNFKIIFLISGSLRITIKETHSCGLDCIHAKFDSNSNRNRNEMAIDSCKWAPEFVPHQLFGLYIYECMYIYKYRSH